MSGDAWARYDVGDRSGESSEARPEAPLSLEGREDFSAGLDEPGDKQAADALTAADQGLTDHGVTSDNQIDGRRYGAEAAAKATMGGDATGLDRPGKPAFATYDVSSSQEVASVKTHWAMDGSLSEGARRNYQRDFEHMLGWGRTPDALEMDGKHIKEASAEGVAVPADMPLNASDEATGEWLRDHSVLRVPDDHVTTVRADLANNARRYPGTYYLSDNPSDAQIEALTDRVQGIGITSAQLQDLIDRRMPGR